MTVADSYAKVIEDATSTTNTVVVSSIYPPLISPDVTEKIIAASAGLQMTCYAKEVTFTDSTTSFYLGDGSTNDGYLQHDGMHLTYPATYRLVQHLELLVKYKTQGVCIQNHHQAKAQKNHGNIDKGRNSMTNYQDITLQHGQFNTSTNRYTTVRRRRQTQHANNTNRIAFSVVNKDSTLTHTYMYRLGHK